MFSEKNISPKQISAVTALVLAIHGEYHGIPGGEILDMGIRSIYHHVYRRLFPHLFMLERFIYRKIKLIYKFIYKTKATKREETYYKYVLPRKSIDDVREDVEAWATKNEEELEMLRSNEQFRKEFLQNLSHEFKTPVFAIQGYVDTLLSGALSNPDVNKRFLEKTSKNVDRLTHLLTDLDEISKLERGELVLYKQNFVIQEMIKEVFESLSGNAEKQQISCVIKKGCESPLTVFADKEKSARC